MAEEPPPLPRRKSIGGKDSEFCLRDKLDPVLMVSWRYSFADAAIVVSAHEVVTRCTRTFVEINRGEKIFLSGLAFPPGPRCASGSGEE